MTRSEALDLLTRLVHRIAPEVDLTAADPDGQLQEEFDLDSMDFLNVMNALQDETGIDVPERDYPLVSSINGFVAYVVAKPAIGASGR